MKLKFITFFWILTLSLNCLAQQRDSKKYNAGLMTIHLVDSSRTYKPNTSETASLHYTFGYTILTFAFGCNQGITLRKC